MQVYLDNSATTRPCAEAVSAVTKSMTEVYYNPSALYAPALSAEHALADARRAIAGTLCAGEKNVLFTSGGTESDNLAIWGWLASQHRPGEVLYTAADTAGLATILASQYTRLSAYAILVFTLVYTPCVSAVAAIRREMNSRKYTLLAIFLQLGVAYVAALMVYQIGSLFVR